MFYIGGDYANSNIELHDVRFSIGETPEDCYPDLRKQWWGLPKSLHIDSWSEIEQADGYDLVLADTPFEGAEKLFFLNLGGYNAADFEEMHKNILLVGESAHKVVHRALKASMDWRIPHKDSVFEVEKVISINDVLRNAGLHLHLVPAKAPKPFTFVSRYIRINQEHMTV